MTHKLTQKLFYDTHFSKSLKPRKMALQSALPAAVTAGRLQPQPTRLSPAIISTVGISLRNHCESAMIPDRYFAHTGRFACFLLLEVSLLDDLEESPHIANKAFTRAFPHRCTKEVPPVEWGSGRLPDCPSSAVCTHCSFPSRRRYDAGF